MVRNPVRVVVGEDNPIVREGVTSVLRRAGFEVVGEAGDAVDLLRAVETQRPDVVVTDIQEHTFFAEQKPAACAKLNTSRFSNSDRGWNLASAARSHAILGADFTPLPSADCAEDTGTLSVP